MFPPAGCRAGSISILVVSLGAFSNRTFSNILKLLFRKDIWWTHCISTHLFKRNFIRDSPAFSKLRLSRNAHNTPVHSSITHPPEYSPTNEYDDCVVRLVPLQLSTHSFVRLSWMGWLMILHIRQAVCIPQSDFRFITPSQGLHLCSELPAPDPAHIPSSFSFILTNS